MNRRELFRLLLLGAAGLAVPKPPTPRVFFGPTSSSAWDLLAAFDELERGIYRIGTIQLGGTRWYADAFNPFVQEIQGIPGEKSPQNPVRGLDLFEARARCERGVEVLEPPPNRRRTAPLAEQVGRTDPCRATMRRPTVRL